MANSKWPDVEAALKDGRIVQWCKDGLIEKDICKKLGVGTTAFNAYKKNHPELCEALKRGKIVADEAVVDALYKNATGYYYFTEEAIKVKDKDGNERVEVKTLQKHKAPEVAAQCFWLKNRRPKEWTDNPNMDDLRRQELQRRITEGFQNF